MESPIQIFHISEFIIPSEIGTIIILTINEENEAPKPQCLRTMPCCFLPDQKFSD